MNYSYKLSNYNQLWVNSQDRRDHWNRRTNCHSPLFPLEVEEPKKFGFVFIEFEESSPVVFSSCYINSLPSLTRFLY